MTGIDATISDTAAGLLTGFSPGATPTADPVADAVAAGEAIRAAIAGGWTLQTFTASDAAWTTPPELLAAVEAFAGAINGGGKGMPGTTANTSTDGIAVPGGVGGSSGGYKMEKIPDPAALASTLAVVIGAAASTNGANGGVTSISSGGTPLVTGITDDSGIATPQGYLLSSSMPGRGGDGGSAVTGTSVASGLDGESSAAAVGGAEGAGNQGTGNRTGTAGSAGATGQTGTTPIAGGGGGGGGGAARVTANSTTATGGAGGNGGFPGGGSGGGGAAAAGAGVGQAVAGGAPGTPAAGLAFLLWR
jgi:hypothetical protein